MKQTAKRKNENIEGKQAFEKIQQFATLHDIDDFEIALGTYIFTYDFGGSDDVDYLRFALKNDWQYEPSRSDGDKSYEDLEYEEAMIYDELVRIFNYEHYLESKKANTITLPEDVTIDLGDREVILEKGDRVEVIQENSYRWEKDIYKIIMELFSQSYPSPGYIFSTLVANSLVNMKKEDKISVDMGAEFLVALGETSLENRERFDKMFPAL